MNFNKLKKHILKIIPICMLTSSYVQSCAGQLSSDERYETFEDYNNLMINDFLEGSIYDLEIEGETLISPIKNAYYGGSASNPVAELVNGKIDKVTSNGNYFICNSSNNYMKLKNETTYTVTIHGRINIKDVDEIEVVPFYRVIKDNGIDYETINLTSHKVKSLTYFELKKTFTTNDEKMHSFGFYTTPSENVKNISVDFSIVEGDYSNRKIPFGEGVESLGENKDLSLISMNKNLIDINKAREIGGYTPAKARDGKILIESDGVNRVSLGFPVYLKKGETYRFYYQNIEGDSSVLGQTVQFHADTSRDNQFGFSVNRNFTWEHSSGIYYLRVYNMYNVGTASANIQLERNDITPYEDYETKEYPIKLKEPLRSVGDIKDKLIIKDGAVYRQTNVGYAVLDGTEAWQRKTNPNGISFFETIDGLKGKHYQKSETDNIKSDIFKSSLITSGSTEIDDYAISLRMRDEGLWRVSTTQTMSLNDFKSWLATNKPVILYELREPIYERLNFDINLSMNDKVSNLVLNSNIPSNMKLTVDRVINKALESVRNAKTDPTLNSIGVARMWINLVPESLVKDQLQSEINSIAEIEELEFERKTVTSNIDVYVKSANTLSMALSTNSVSFDNYSGVSDMEKLKAVEITINSSLPYSLNSYLVTEIQNSDASKIMNRELFNIREASEGVYKKFTDIGQKLILKDDCASGNDIVHNIDMKLDGSASYEADIYKTVVKFEAQQK